MNEIRGIPFVNGMFDINVIVVFFHYDINVVPTDKKPLTKK